MANVITTARTNYFNPEDWKDFQTFISGFDGVTMVPHATEPYCMALLCETDSGDWPSQEEPADETFYEAVASRIADGEVVVFMEISKEGMRSLGGAAYAFNNKLESVSVDLEEIYERCKDLGAFCTYARN